MSDRSGREASGSSRNYCRNGSEFSTDNTAGTEFVAKMKNPWQMNLVDENGSGQ